jgi:hypothetical protein
VGLIRGFFFTIQLKKKIKYYSLTMPLLSRKRSLVYSERFAAAKSAPTDSKLLAETMSLSVAWIC